MDDAGFEGRVGAAELLLGGGSHALYHVHQSAVMISAVAGASGLLLDTLRVLEVVYVQIVSLDW